MRQQYKDIHFNMIILHESYKLKIFGDLDYTRKDLAQFLSFLLPDIEHIYFCTQLGPSPWGMA